MDSISRLRDSAFLVRRTQTARPFRVFGKIVRPMRAKKREEEKENNHQKSRFRLLILRLSSFGLFGVHLQTPAPEKKTFFSAE